MMYKLETVCNEPRIFFVYEDWDPISIYVKFNTNTWQWEARLLSNHRIIATSPFQHDIASLAIGTTDYALDQGVADIDEAMASLWTRWDIT